MAQFLQQNRVGIIFIGLMLAMHLGATDMVDTVGAPAGTEA